MKKIFVIALTVVASSTSFAQNNTQEAIDMTNKLVHDLSLTAEQAQRVSDIYQGIASKNEAALTNTSNTEQYKQDAIKYNTEACKNMINDVLTPEQRTLWAQQQQTSAPAPSKEMRKANLKNIKQQTPTQQSAPSKVGN